MAEGRKPVVEWINLGCPKNVVDAEETLGLLARDGFAVRTDGAEVDVVVINTCGFIEASKQESIDAILGAAERKRDGSVRKLIVAGCLAQRYARELPRELPEVDAFVGVGRPAEVARTVADVLAGRERLIRVERRPQHRFAPETPRLQSTAPWTAYLKISEGCNHRCTFCAIPSIRGRHVSKPLDAVLEEAERLAACGVRELNLVAQDSTQYGYDLYGEAMLPRLLRELSGVGGLHWIRLFYCYPSRVNGKVIDAIAGTPKVCAYIDMPLQHADRDVLRAMSRPGGAESYLRLVRRFREASPDIAIRTTFIVGFPGETAEAFENLMRFVEAARFDRVGVFEYSREEGTPSAKLPGQVASGVKRSRRERLMRLQQDISLERGRRWVGRDLEVLVERPAAGQSSGNGNGLHARAVGRSFRDAPDIDGVVYLRGVGAAPGQFVRARVTDASAYDLTAEPIEPQRPAR
jgi:ribosomal protein S12 methylthiotransferase